jgi:hypothetical protein
MREGGRSFASGVSSRTQGVLRPSHIENSAVQAALCFRIMMRTLQTCGDCPCGRSSRACGQYAVLCRAVGDGGRACMVAADAEAASAVARALWALRVRHARDCRWAVFGVWRPIHIAVRDSAACAANQALELRHRDHQRRTELSSGKKCTIAGHEKVSVDRQGAGYEDGIAGIAVHCTAGTPSTTRTAKSRSRSHSSSTVAARPNVGRRSTSRYSVIMAGVAIHSTPGVPTM